MILIGIPTRGSWSPTFGLSLVGAVAQLPTNQYIIMAIDGESCPQARNRLCNILMSSDMYTHLLQFDDDMIFPLATISRLMAHDVDIIGANYPTRQGDPVPTASVNGKRFWGSAKLAQAVDKQPVDVIGGGILLIKREVLINFPKPYFQYKYVEETDHIQTEDVYFCQKARRIGYTVWCDLKLSEEIAHGTSTNTIPGARVLRDAQALETLTFDTERGEHV